MTSTIKPEKSQVSELFSRAFALYKSGDWVHAMEYFRMVTFMAPLEGRFWISLGHATKKTGDLEGAIEAYKTALLLLSTQEQHQEPYQEQHSDSDLWLSLAECLIDQGQKKEGLLALNEAIALAPPHEKDKLELIQTQWSNKG